MEKKFNHLSEILNDDTFDDDKSPYTSVSSRPPLDIESDDELQNELNGGIQQPSIPSVKDAILSRNPQNVLSGLDDSDTASNSVSPSVMEFLKAKNQGNFISNMSHAANRLAQGANTPKDSGLSASINAQNADIGKTIQSEQDRRVRVQNAIENRKMRQALFDHKINKEGKTDDLAIDRLMTQVMGKINNHHIIKPSEVNLASLYKSKGILENDKVPLTPQSLSDSEQDIANALTLRGMGGTEGKIKRTEINTIGRDIAHFKQKYLNRPDIDLRKEEPELVAQVKRLNSALIDDYITTIQEAKNNLLDDFGAAYGDPRIHQRLDKLRGNYNSRSKPPISEFPKQVRKKDEKGNTQVATVSNAQELAEAAAEGWQ